MLLYELIMWALLQYGIIGENETELAYILKVVTVWVKNIEIVNVRTNIVENGTAWAKNVKIVNVKTSKFKRILVYKLTI